MNTLYLNNTEIELVKKAITFYRINKHITKYVDDTLDYIFKLLEDSQHQIQINLTLSNLELVMATLTYYKENQEC